jgi:hypothetical protein
MACLDSDVVMWWCDFGDFHQSRFKTWFWQCSRLDPTKPNQLGLGQSNPIGPDWEPDFGNAPNFGDDILRSENWHFPKKMLKMPDSNSLQSVPGAGAGILCKSSDLGFLPKFSPKILWFPQERFHFLARLPTVLGDYCQIRFLQFSLDDPNSQIRFSQITK